jgi:hypothetical protein
VKRWKAIVALALALVYLPAASNCLLEMAGLLSCQNDCCEQTTAGDGAPRDYCPYGCCPIEYAVHFHFGVNHAVTAAPVAAIPLCRPEPIFLTPPQQVYPIIPDGSPPELARAWQFCFRTALPPRAPSLAS